MKFAKQLSFLLQVTGWSFTALFTIIQLFVLHQTSEEMVRNFISGPNLCTVLVTAMGVAIEKATLFASTFKEEQR